MIRQLFDVDGYWKVVVFYDVDYDLFFPVFEELERIGMSRKDMESVWQELMEGRAKAVTYSNSYYRTSVVLFNPHEDKTDYLDSVVHEAEHVKQAMLKAYHVEDRDEPPAYTMGYLVGKMWKVVSKIICRC